MELIKLSLKHVRVIENTFERNRRRFYVAGLCLDMISLVQ